MFLKWLKGTQRFDVVITVDHRGIFQKQASGYYFEKNRDAVNFLAIDLKMNIRFKKKKPSGES